MMSVETRATVFVSTRTTLYAKWYRENTTMPVMIALYPLDGSSNDTMSICMASSGPIAICDVSMMGGVMVLFRVLFVCMQSLHCDVCVDIFECKSWTLVAFTALLDDFSDAWVIAKHLVLVLDELVY